MADYVLDKGMLVQGSAALVANRFVSFGTVDWSVNPTISAGAQAAGVAMENVDAAKVTTGKVYADVRVFGIALVKLGTGGITRGGQVATDASGQAVAAASTNSVLGIAMESGSAGDLVNIALSNAGTF